MIQFFKQLEDGKSLSFPSEWIGSLPSTMSGEAIPLFKDEDTETDYQLHLSYTWIDALHTAPFGSADDFVHGLLHVTKDDECEVIRDPNFVIPLGKLFVNKSSRSDWTGYEVFVSSSLGLWVIYNIDEGDPEKFYAVECSLFSYTIPASEKDGHVQTEKQPSFKIARLWPSLSTLASADFEKAAQEISISQSRIYMGSFHLLEFDERQAMSLTADSIGQNLETRSRRIIVNAESSAGRELLLLAYKNSDEAIIELKHGDRHLQHESDDQTLIFLAAKNQDETVVELLVATGKADVNSKDHIGRTPLSWAAGEGYEGVVRLLLATDKAEINSKDHYGWTPLSWAAATGHEAVVELLLILGKADIDSKDNRGRTPLLWAAANGHEAVVELLLILGKADIDSKDNRGRTPLLWAAANGHEAVVELLLILGKADIDSKDDQGRTPLSWAAERRQYPTQRLLERIIAGGSKSGGTPLSSAAASSEHSTKRQLERIKAERSKSGETPLS